MSHEPAKVYTTKDVKRLQANIVDAVQYDNANLFDPHFDTKYLPEPCQATFWFMYYNHRPSHIRCAGSFALWIKNNIPDGIAHFSHKGV